MKTILITYIIIINLTGFLIMGIDKQKARHKKWRIRESTLFLVALLFGSIGVLTGMYVFRHKTRHLTFTIGIPVIMVLQLLAVILLFSWNRQQMERPVQVVQYELDLIRQLDSETIQSFISYENLMNSHLASGEIDSDTTEAVSLFFKNFEYNIHNEEINDNQATVTVQISNIDTRALARDLCMEILKKAVVIYPESSSASTTSDYYRLLRDTLASHTYDTVATVAYFHLQRDDAGWYILSDSALEDELVSGFISYMNDPYILSADEVLTIHLDALKDLTEEQWMDYLDIEDIFSTYNANYASQIDQEYIHQLSQSFDCEILRCTENGSDAEAVIRVTSIDMTNVLTAYKAALLNYAASTQSLRDTDLSFSNETSRLLLQALEENQQTDATDVTLTFSNTGSTWEVYFNSDFINALMGDIEGAINTFNAVNEESQIISSIN